MHEGERQADGNAGEAWSCDALGDQQDHQNEGCRQDDLEQECPAHVDAAVVVAVGAKGAGVVCDPKG